MNPPRTQRRKRHSQSLSVPGWYYIVLGAVALIGLILIIISTQVRLGGLTTEGDYYLGSDDAPVTIIDWSNFT